MLLLGHGALRGAAAGGAGLDLVVAVVAGLSERDPFVFPDGRAEAAAAANDNTRGEGEEDSEEEEEEEEVKLLRQAAHALKLARFRQWRHPTSDALARLRAAGAFAYHAASSATGAAEGGR